MPDWVIAILTNEAFLSVLLSIITGVVTWVQGSAWWDRRGSKRKELALEIMAAAALKLMPRAEQYKRDSANGTLPKSRIDELNSAFAADVKAIGSQVGIDVAKLVPGALWDMFRHGVVERVKGTKKLPSSVERMLP